MKTAAKELKREWEQAQWLELIQMIKMASKVLNNAFKTLKWLFNLTLFVVYILTRWAWNLAKLALFSQPYTQIVRDETWIYRQIK